MDWPSFFPGGSLSQQLTLPMGPASNPICVLFAQQRDSGGNRRAALRFRFTESLALARLWHRLLPGQGSVMRFRPAATDNWQNWPAAPRFVAPGAQRWLALLAL